MIPRLQTPQITIPWICLDHEGTQPYGFPPKINISGHESNPLWHQLAPGPGPVGGHSRGRQCSPASHGWFCNPPHLPQEIQEIPSPKKLNAPHMIPKVNRSNATRQGCWLVFHIRGKGQPSNYHQVYPLLWQVSFPKFRASRSLPGVGRQAGWCSRPPRPCMYLLLNPKMKIGSCSLGGIWIRLLMLS